MLRRKFRAVQAKARVCIFISKKSRLLFFLYAELQLNLRPPLLFLAARTSA